MLGAEAVPPAVAEPRLFPGDAPLEALRHGRVGHVHVGEAGIAAPVGQFERVQQRRLGRHLVVAQVRMPAHAAAGADLVEVPVLVDVGHHDDVLGLRMAVFLGDMRLQLAEVPGEGHELRRAHRPAAEDEHEVVHESRKHAAARLLVPRRQRIQADDLGPRRRPQRPNLELHISCPAHAPAKGLGS